MTLSDPFPETVTVRYHTSDESATAGLDYVRTVGVLAFAPGETAKTVSVQVLDDDLDEWRETMKLWLSHPNVPEARISSWPATGTIDNTDRMPTAWIARFGRTVADQVLDAVDARMRAKPATGVEARLAGQRIGPGPAFPGSEVRPHSPAQGQTVTGQDLLPGTSFSLTGDTQDDGFVSIWGRGAVTRFDGREGDLAVDGAVATGLLGSDWTRRRWTTGLLVSQSSGNGAYRGAGGGTAAATLTGVWPWARHALGERLSVWGVAGYGEGELTLDAEDKDGTRSRAIRTSLDLWMAAVGLRGVALDGGGDGFTLAVKTDAMIVRTASDAVSGPGGNLAAAEAEVTRLRLGLEGSRPLPLADGSTLTPSMEIGLRHDGGDAETGFGADIAAGIAWTDPESGLGAELRGRVLLAHESRGFRERGLSASFAWDPVTGERGPRLSLTWTQGGSARGGADALLGRTALAGLAANEPGDGSRHRRLEARFGHGFPAFSGRFTAAPEFAVGLSSAGRDYSLAWRLARGGRAPDGSALELAVTVLRRETAADGPAPSEHAAGVRATSRF